MARRWFAKGTTFVWKREGREEAFLIRQSLLDGRLLVENQTSGGEERHAVSDLLGAFASGALVFALGGPNIRRRDRALPPTEYTFGDFLSLPEAVRDEAWRRYQLILPYLAMSRRERGQALRDLKTARAAALKATRERGLLGSTKDDKPRVRPSRSKIGEADSPSTIKDWLKSFGAGGHDIRALVPLAAGKPGGRGGCRLEADVEATITAVIERAKQRVTSGEQPAVSLGELEAVARVVVGTLNAERAAGGGEPGDVKPLRAPSRDVIAARLVAAQLDHLLKRRRSPLEAHKDEQTGVGSRPTRVYERIEIDHSPIDLIVVDDHDRLPIGRPEATYAMDGHSRYPVGLHISFAPVSANAVLACLAQCILPEVPGGDIRTVYGTEHARLSFGLPETVFLDNERCNVGKAVREACGQLSINLEQQPLGQPWLKGGIERYIRTHHNDLLHKLPGTTFSNIVRRGDYDPMAMACITYTKFKEIMHIWLYDIYAERPHDGLGKRIPARVMEEGLRRYPPALDHSAEHVRLTLMDTDRRTVQHYGIDLEGLRYQGDALRDLRARLQNVEDKEVKVNFNREDLGQIYVLDEFEGRWLTIPANPDFAAYARGLSLWKHHFILKVAKKTNPRPDLDALARARMKIQRLVAQEFALKGGKVTRKKEARILGIGVELPAIPAGDVLAGGAGAAAPAPPPPAVTGAPAVPADDGEAMVLASIADEPEPATVPATRRAGGKPRRVRPVPAEEESDELPDRTGWGGTVRGPQRPRGGATTTEEPDRVGWGGGVRGPARPRPTEPPEAATPKAPAEEGPDRTGWRAGPHLPGIARRRRMREEG